MRTALTTATGLRLRSSGSYDTNVLGTKGPRKMTVVVPPVSDDGHVMATTEEGMLERVKQGEFGDCQKLHNKAPRWNESLGAYCLNFNGRVTLPSVKNFQLQLEGASDPNQVSLQFGKTGDSTFTMDYSYPLSPLQAFQVRCVQYHIALVGFLTPEGRTVSLFSWAHAVPFCVNCMHIHPCTCILDRALFF